MYVIDWNLYYDLAYSANITTFSDKIDLKVTS